VLAYACLLPIAPMEPKLIVLVTGDSCAGKDYCADIWVSEFICKGLKARAVSISDATKREYATASGADLSRLLGDRAYKEQHRPALTRFFQDQVRKQPLLPEKHFLDAVYGAIDVEVLVITWMRDHAPVATLSHLVPDSRLLEVHVQASEQTRQIRQGRHINDGDGEDKQETDNKNSELNRTTFDYRPSFIFDNDTTRNDAVKRFAELRLLNFFHEDLQHLEDMVRSVPDFPRPHIEFHHVLGISQQPGGLALCTTLLQSNFAGD
jgi:phosphomevalonate kinase